MNFEEFFRTATITSSEPDGRKPYPYQERFAEGDSLPELLNVPTGVGKTATAILGWLYRRRFHDENVRQMTPRRLVYCLPMRVLVEQTRDFAVGCLENLGMLAKTPGAETPVTDWVNDQGDTGKRIAVSVLMGGTEGDELRDWTLWPERDAILIGTQDMLLSRALNRGYASGRAQWPMEFALLNNDCLWVFDEIQLMGSGLATTAQLDAFRLGGKQTSGIGVIGKCNSLWMSATAESRWLDTIDHDVSQLSKLELTLDEREPTENADPASPEGLLGQRLRAIKTLRKVDNSSELQPKDLAQIVMNGHRRHTEASSKPILTIVVVNVVERARAIYHSILNANALPTKRSKIADPTVNATMPELLLLHSRFRQEDRRRVIDKLLLAQKIVDEKASEPTASISNDPELSAFVERVARNGLVVVSTQVIEAGVDISSRLLFTELAPWASLVQRFGRCNRRGEHSSAEIFWLDFKSTDDKSARPYKLDELQLARRYLSTMEGRSAGPNELESHREKEGIELPYQPLHVLRRKDLIELFDTTPDLAGNDLDVSRYIRDGDDIDVKVFWRNIVKPDKETAQPQREELCSLPVYEFINFAKLHRDRVWRWNFLESQWTKARPDAIFPGQSFLVAADAGGYLPEVGWKWDSVDSVQPVDLPMDDQPANRGYDGDPHSENRRWQTVAEHTDEVCSKLDEILVDIKSASFGLPEAALRLAARWHDRGKAHEIFQAAVPTDEAHVPGEWAKAPNRFRRYRRKHFRHELASALAVLQAPTTLIPNDVRDLVAYLTAAHHGKVRLSIRSLPGEVIPHDADRRIQHDLRFARGIWEHDHLPTVNLGGDVGTIPSISLSLQCMEMGLGDDGAPSWTDRMLHLRDRVDIGIFRLAYLEALLRAADCRASAAPGNKPFSNVSTEPLENA